MAYTSGKGGGAASFSYAYSASSNTAGANQDAFTDSDPYASYTYGTADYMTDMAYSHANTSLSGSETITLSALVTPGGTLALVKVRELYLRNLSSTSSIVIGNAAIHAWTGAFSGTVTIPPLGCIRLNAPAGSSYGVTAGSNDQLMINCPSGTGNYVLGILGASA